MGIETVRAGDINVAHRWDGPDGAPVLMMAHAMGTSHRIWDPQVEVLSRHYRLLRYDWRGHGDTSAPPGPYTLAGFVEDAVGLMDVLGLPAVHWVGISTGGMIGQGLALAHPDRVETLTICNSTSQATPWYRGWVARRQAVVREAGMAPVWEMTKRLWFTDAFVDAGGPRYRAVQAVFERTPVAGYLGGTSAVVDLAYRDRLHQVRAPTHVIAAGDDPVTPIPHSMAIAQRIPGARLSVIDGQRHFSNVEVPDRFNAVLLDALRARVPGGDSSDPGTSGGPRRQQDQQQHDE